MVAVLLAAGCVSQGSDNQTPLSPGEKYVVLQHNTNYETSTISGTCVSWPYPTFAYGYSFDEKSGVLSLSSLMEPVNNSLLLFYGQGYRGTGMDGNSWMFVYSVPRQVTANVTIETIKQDGTVEFSYDDITVLLKPKEHWENITHEISITEPFYVNATRPGQPAEEVWPGCTEEIIITDSIYNAGVFNKTGIVIGK
jgi:hypothetical protein